MHPARWLDGLGFAAAAERARRLRWSLTATLPALRPRHLVPLTTAWLREPAGRRSYRVLSEAELVATRRSDTAFVFGSGRSLVDIGEDEWDRIAAFDTVAFSHFHCQRWVRVDYHLVAEVVDIPETTSSIRSNPCYGETIFLMLKGLIAEASNVMIGRRLLPQGARIFRLRRVERGRTIAPSRAFALGVVHGTNTIHDVVNFAVLMGWRRIVIAGVDLYDKQYFWLPPGEMRPDEKEQFEVGSTWAQAGQVVETFRLWREILEPEGIELAVYDARSLLAGALPVFRWPDASAVL